MDTKYRSMDHVAESMNWDAHVLFLIESYCLAGTNLYEPHHKTCRVPMISMSPKIENRCLQKLECARD